MNYKTILISTIMALLVMTCCAHAYNGDWLSQGFDKEPAQLELYNKDTTTWQRLPDGSYADMYYNKNRFRLVAQRLEPLTLYALIRYSEDRGHVIMKPGYSNFNGTMRMRGRMFGYTTNNINDTIWIIPLWHLEWTSWRGFVPGKVVKFKQYDPTRYLFEHDVI